MQIQRLSKVIISMISFTFGGLGFFSLWLTGWDIHSAPAFLTLQRSLVRCTANAVCTVIHLLSTWRELFCTRMHWKYLHYCFALGCWDDSRCTVILYNALRCCRMHWDAVTQICIFHFLCKSSTSSGERKAIC